MDECLPHVLAQIRRWEFGFGDPTPLGLATTFGYGIAAILAYGAMRVAREPRPGRVAADGRMLRRFWFAVTIALVLLGLNKQLDFQRLVTQIARDAAKDGGWYRNRKPVQIAAVVAVAAIGVGIVAVLGFRLRRLLAEVWLPLAGLALIGLYIAARVTSLHAVDVLLTIGPVKLKWILEPLGVALVAAGAWRALRDARREPR